MNIEFTLFVSPGMIAHQNVMKNRKNIKLLISRSLTNFSLSPQKKSEQDQIRIFSNSQQTVDRSSSKKTQVGEKHRRLQNTTTSSSSGETIGTTCLKSFFSALCFQNHMFLMQFFLFYFSDEARSEEPTVG